MFEIKGNKNTAICYAKMVEGEAVEQIRRMCDYVVTEGNRVRIMPDVHAGKGCTIGRYLDDYLHDVELCQKFAKRNRELMAEILLDRVGIFGADGFHTIHNYIDTDEMILRKGAIAAHEGELVLIPINMRDGSVLAKGKGNAEWNYSAPHGAGRIMSRTKAKQTLSMEDYKNSMEGIYTTSVSVGTLDEAPMAYKAISDIIDEIEESVEVIDIMKPVYNFKADGSEAPWQKKKTEIKNNIQA